MENVRKWVISNRSRSLGSLSKSGNAFRSFLENEASWPPFTSPSRTAATEPMKWLGAIGVKGIHLGRRASVGDKIVMFCASPIEMRNYELQNTFPSFARAFATRASKKPEGTRSEAKKDVSTVEDPFDAPTYHIPEKPVTFTEGASYSLVILAGLGVAAAAAYGVFKELIFQPKEYKIFNIALKRIQDDSQVRMRIGSPITGYGQDSRNRAARQRIPNKIYTDEDGVEHVEVNFYVRGPHGAGKVFAHMFKDKSDRQWKYTYLVVQIHSPSPSELMLESYLPSYEPSSSSSSSS